MALWHNLESLPSELPIPTLKPIYGARPPRFRSSLQSPRPPAAVAPVAITPIPGLNFPADHNRTLSSNGFSFVLNCFNNHTEFKQFGGYTISSATMDECGGRRKSVTRPSEHGRWWLLWCQGRLRIWVAKVSGQTIWSVFKGFSCIASLGLATGGNVILLDDLNRLRDAQQQAPTPAFSPSQLYASLPLVPGARTISVLDLDTPEPNTTSLTSRLRVAGLDDGAKVALSHTPRCMPQGYDIEVTASCHDALQTIRARFGAVSIWVDAICIRQDDLMQDIYSLAASVYVWLGPGNARSDQAMQHPSNRARIGWRLPLAVLAARDDEDCRLEMLRWVRRLWRDLFFRIGYDESNVSSTETWSTAHGPPQQHEHAPSSFESRIQAYWKDHGLAFDVRNPSHRAPLSPVVWLRFLFAVARYCAASLPRELWMGFIRFVLVGGGKARQQFHISQFIADAVPVSVRALDVTEVEQAARDKTRRAKWSISSVLREIRPEDRGSSVGYNSPSARFPKAARPAANTAAPPDPTSNSPDPGEADPLPGMADMIMRPYNDAQRAAADAMLQRMQQKLVAERHRHVARQQLELAGGDGAEIRSDDLGPCRPCTSSSTTDVVEAGDKVFLLPCIPAPGSESRSRRGPHEKQNV
ncbi:hypothetical protein B0T24DRAFT_598769 [Lasiosphaeria ovina]|uniref:Heterokaryon incompatibility domain-containing protein n=1 Tax=Lasiosphaeria ovina TaxID=92902 RepID=A0AAE0JU30_9PEZI|nr:hypothetical protein B0T24DRAFT_598769 [Lasiosphaeria ovina]